MKVSVMQIGGFLGRRERRNRNQEMKIIGFLGQSGRMKVNQ